MRLRGWLGAIVVPVEEHGHMFLEAGMGWESNEDVMDEFAWVDDVGIVLDVSEFDPPREYLRLRLLVCGRVGWTYSDYVHVVK